MQVIRKGLKAHNDDEMLRLDFRSSTELQVIGDLHHCSLVMGFGCVPSTLDVQGAGVISAQVIIFGAAEASNHFPRSFQARKDSAQCHAGNGKSRKPQCCSDTEVQAITNSKEVAVLPGCRVRFS